MKEIKITARNLKITDKVKKQLLAKFNTLDRYFKDINDIQVILSHAKGQFIVDAIVSVRSGRKIMTKISNYSYIVAINVAADKIEKQLIRFKDKTTKPYHALKSAPLKGGGLDQDDWY